jgi:hypothetical protein
MEAPARNERSLALLHNFAAYRGLADTIGTEHDDEQAPGL